MTDPEDTPLTEEDVRRLTAFANNTVNRTRLWLPGPRWPIGWQSIAEREVRNTERRVDGRPWGDRPVLTTYATSALFLYAAGESLSAMATALTTATTPLVPAILTRATIEAGSKAFWMMAPDVTARQRVVRWVLCRVASAHHLGVAAAEVDPLGDPSRYGDTPEAVLSAASALGLTVTGTKTPACEGTTYPGYTARANALVGPLAPGAYALYSGMAHAELYAVLQSWRQAEPDEHGNRVVIPHTGRRAVYAAFATAALALVRPVRTALRVLDLRGKYSEALNWEREVHVLERALG